MVDDPYRTPATRPVYPLKKGRWICGTLHDCPYCEQQAAVIFQSDEWNNNYHLARPCRPFARIVIESHWYGDARCEEPGHYFHVRCVRCGAWWIHVVDAPITSEMKEER